MSILLEMFYKGFLYNAILYQNLISCVFEEISNRTENTSFSQNLLQLFFKGSNQVLINKEDTL